MALPTILAPRGNRLLFIGRFQAGEGGEVSGYMLFVGLFPQVVQHVVFREPSLQGPFHVAVGPSGVTIARMPQRLLNEVHLVRQAREESIPEAVLIEVGNMPKGVAQSAVERLRELGFFEPRGYKRHKLIGELGLIFGGVELRRCELIGCKCFHGVIISNPLRLSRG